MTEVRAPLLLVVDDDPINVELLCELLHAMDYRVEGALDGPSALVVARERQPDLILLDIMMPGMNGYEVCRRLRAVPETTKIPVVFVTALSDTADKLQAIEAGGDDFLTKPFSRPILLARIRSLLRLKAANDQVEQSYRRLKEMEQLKDDLMKMIVHDLKSPLTTVLGTLEMVTDGDLGALAPEQHRLLSDAQKRGADMLQLMDDLLELAQLEESRVQLQLAPMAVDRLLRDVADEWGVRTEQEGAHLEIGSAPAVSLMADVHLLRRIFSNLVGNAVKHGGPGVQIRLGADPAPDGGVRFTVADDGGGIPPAYHEMIFHKYGSIPRAPALEARSSGLGLTFCKMAVEAHGGSIWVRSGPGLGSEFHFTIPFRPTESSVERIA